MVNLTSGSIAGVMAAILMGIVSEAGYRVGLFKSSLILIDGSFLLKSLGKTTGGGRYLAGIPIHLFTGAVFGAVYVAGTGLLALDPYSPSLTALYFCLLWLAMLFIALPIAGQGMLGRKISSWAWLEQLVLHFVFAIAFYFSLMASG